MDQFLPSFPLAHARVLVVGAGDAAENKLRLFRTAPCELVWRKLDRTAPPPRDLNPHTQIIADTNVPLGAFNGFRIVFIAVDDERLARRLVKRARRAGALVNAVDRPSLSDFHTPAIVDRGAITIAFASGGAAPVLVRDLRAQIETVIPKGIGLLAESAKGLRERIGGMADTVDARRRIWQRALRGPAVEHADRGDVEATRRALDDSLDRLEGGAVEPGIVHLVGAGPGDPELLTVKASRLIRDADVVVYDRLVSPEVIDRVRRDAIRIDVGKTKGHHPVPQDEINRILIDHATAGHRVVRLKGGDSYIFGRGGEEVEELRAAGIKAEVVPGISAALACAASAQIPLTHRDMAQAVTFVTGQPKRSGPEPDFRALAAPNHTVVFYMGVGKADQLSKRLILAGRDASTPVAIVENGSLPNERVITGVLDELGALTTQHEVRAPAVLIIGETAALAAEERVWARGLAAAALVQTADRTEAA